MSIAAWYFHKAEQCGDMAKAASTAAQRDSYKQDEKLWLQIADKAASAEEKQFGREPK